MCLKTRLPGIIKQAKSVIHPSKKMRSSRNWHKITMYGLVDKVYDDLLKAADEKNYSSNFLHQAVHFEIKKRTMNNPYDLSGSRICKIIESAYNEIRIMKEESRQTSTIYLWHCRIKYFIRHTIIKIKNFHQKQPLVLFKIYSLPILISSSTGVFFAVHYLPSFITWLEGSIFLFLSATISVLILRWRNSFLSYTRVSVMKAIATTTFSVLFLYLYDTSTDIEVILVYFRFYQIVTEGILQTNEKYNMTITNPYFNIYGNLSEWKNLQDNDTTKMIVTLSFWQYTFGWYVCVFSFILLCSTILSFKSLPSIVNKIKTSLLLDGNQVRSKSNMQHKKAQKTDIHSESLTTQEILTRNKHAIEEAGVESTYQFIFTASIYFCFCYVISISKAATETVFYIDNSFNSSEVTTETSNTTALIKVIQHLDETFVFSTFSKSFLASLLALSMSQVNMNAIQHEKSISMTQFACYAAASIFNTISYSLVIIFCITIALDLYILFGQGFVLNYLSTNKTTSIFLQHPLDKVYFITAPPLCCILIVISQPIFRKFAFRCRKKFKTDRDKIFVKETPFLGLFSLSSNFLPPSQTPLSNRKLTTYISYNYKYSLNLRYAYYKQTVSYIHGLQRVIEVGCGKIIILFLLQRGIIGNKIAWKQIVTLSTSPSAVSPARYNLMIFGIIFIPLGYVLSLVFVYLYFKFDNGFFSISNIEFEFDNNRMLQCSTRHALKDCFKIKNRSLSDQGPAQSSGSEHSDSVIEQCKCQVNIEENNYEGSIGEWVDLNGLNRHGNKHAIKEDIKDNDENDELFTILSLDESEKNLLEEEIKHSFPYYRSYIEDIDS